MRGSRKGKNRIRKKDKMESPIFIKNIGDARRMMKIK
jgi:hypothetical protein